MHAGRGHPAITIAERGKRGRVTMNWPEDGRCPQWIGEQQATKGKLPSKEKKKKNEDEGASSEESKKSKEKQIRRWGKEWQNGSQNQSGKCHNTGDG